MLVHPATGHCTMPWANGRGTTVQMLREAGLRLSVATVVEDGPFSLFPGVARNLTVISGPGFRLVGEVALDCLPLRPVTFPGDLMVSAAGVTAPSQDFNVMTALSAPRPMVSLAGEVAAAPRAFLLVLGAGQVNGVAVGPRDLVEARGEALWLTGGAGIAVTL